jgi:DNA-binding NtrC family response regulator
MYWDASAATRYARAADAAGNGSSSAHFAYSLGRDGRLQSPVPSPIVSGMQSISAMNDARPVIMVLEPEVLLRMSIADYLRECGYKVIESPGADDLWTVIGAGKRLDLVFTEVRLVADGDGFELAKRLRQEHPGIDVVLTSSAPNAAKKSKELCEHGPMKKPYRSEDVAARVRTLLNRRRAAMPNLPVSQ